MKAWPPPNLTGEGRKVQQEWLYHFLQNPTTIRPWLKIRMPSFDFNAKQTNMTIRYFRSMDKLPMQIETPTKIVRTTEQQKLGKEVFAQYQCAACHVVGKVPEGKDLGSLAPDFRLTKTRLRYEWLEDWLKYPQKTPSRN